MLFVASEVRLRIGIIRTHDADVASPDLEPRDQALQTLLGEPLARCLCIFVVVAEELRRVVCLPSLLLDKSASSRSPELSNVEYIDIVFEPLDVSYRLDAIAYPQVTSELVGEVRLATGWKANLILKHEGIYTHHSDYDLGL